MTWQEFTKTYGSNKHRTALIQGMKAALNLLKTAGCKTIYMDGSFVTNPNVEPYPGDYDACFVLNEISEGRALDPVFRLQGAALDTETQKARFGGEFYPAEIPSFTGERMLDFFQTDKETGRPKGIVVLDIRRLP